MNVLQTLNNLFHAPEASVMANQAVMSAELAARQGMSALQADVERRKEQVAGPDEYVASQAVGERLTAEEVERRRRRAAAKAPDPDAPPAKKHSLDILA